jgi:hypothetical protein
LDAARPRKEKTGPTVDLRDVLHLLFDAAPYHEAQERRFSMTRAKKNASAKVTIIAHKGTHQAINCLLEDRDEREWLVASAVTEAVTSFSTIPVVTSSRT